MMRLAMISFTTALTLTACSGGGTTPPTVSTTLKSGASLDGSLSTGNVGADVNSSQTSASIGSVGGGGFSYSVYAFYSFNLTPLRPSSGSLQVSKAILRLYIKKNASTDTSCASNTLELRHVFYGGEFSFSTVSGSGASGLKDGLDITGANTRNDCFYTDKVYTFDVTTQVKEDLAVAARDGLSQFMLKNTASVGKTVDVEFAEAGRDGSPALELTYTKP